MAFKVERHSFFDQQKRSILRFSEYSYNCTHEEYQLCNCTTSTPTRPDGVPKYVQQGITYESRVDDLAIEIHLTGSPWVTFKWGSNKHAYFIFHNDNIQVEVNVPEYGPVEYFFTHIYIGNEVNTSKLMNGHSPSRIIQLDKINKNQLWLHSCDWGKEVIRTLPIGDEFNEWSSAILCADAIRSIIKDCANDMVTDVHEICKIVEDNEILTNNITRLQTILVSFLSIFQQTQVFKLGSEIDIEIREFVKRK